MKKLFTLLLVVAMVLGIVSTAMAATTTTPSTVAGAAFSDISGNDAEADITLLAVKGILKGDAGATTVRPDSTITRAEFAAMVVRMLGKETLANSLNSMKPATKDEIPTWAYGVVNVAKSMGIMIGDPDGSFRPNDNVTFAEALAMLERAIGQDKKVVGTWPTNVLIVADDLDLGAGVDVFANTPATRGEVAIMMVNTMNTDKYLGIKDDGSEKTQPAILAGSTYEGLVSFIDAANNAIDLKYDNNDDNTIETNSFDLATKVSLVDAKTFADLLNVNVKAITNSDDEIVYMEVIDDANVITGTFDSWDKNDDGDDVIVLADDSEYIVNTADVEIEKNTQDGIVWAGKAAVAHDDAVVLNLVDDEVVYINATEVNGDNLVTDADVSYDEDTELYTLSTVTGGDFTTDEDMSVTIDGAAKKISDIEKGDVVYVTTDYYDEAILDEDVNTDADKTDKVFDVTNILSIAAYRATVKGEVTKFKTSADGTTTVTIKLADGTTKAYDLDGITNVTPAIGSTVEYRLNKAGDARVEVNATAATTIVYVADKYAENTGSDHYYVTFDVAGVEKTYECDSEATYDSILASPGGVDDSSLGTYTLDNGKVDSWTPVALDAVTAEVVSVDTANGVVVLKGNFDGIAGDELVAFGADGLSVYEETDTNEYDFAGVSTLAKGDTVEAQSDILGLIVIPE